MTDNNWGGARAGAGRPKGSTKERVRKSCNMRAYPEEWEVIKMVATLIKKKPQHTQEIINLVNKLSNE